MLKRKLILDTHCEVYEFLKPWADQEFWLFDQHEIVPGALYIIGRRQFLDNRERIRELVEADTIKVILSNPHEGSETLYGLTLQCRIPDLVQAQRILLIGGGDMEPGWPCLQFDSFLPKLYDYEENLAAAADIDSRYINNKPYKFLFLNGRLRPHRRYFINRFRDNGTLNHALWTLLDAGEIGPAKTLPVQYEAQRYRHLAGREFKNNYVKMELFDNEWGEIYLESAPYRDTYFSFVTETVFDYPHSFRTEKIWKPIAIGHPFVVAANTGFYRDLRNLGFKTFAPLIDESFDAIENNQQRLQRLGDTVEDLVTQDLDQFQKECYSICKYNQQHLADLRPRVRAEFADRFFQFIRHYQFDE